MVTLWHLHARGDDVSVLADDVVYPSSWYVFTHTSHCVERIFTWMTHTYCKSNQNASLVVWQRRSHRDCGACRAHVFFHYTDKTVFCILTHSVGRGLQRKRWKSLQINYRGIWNRAYSISRSKAKNVVLPCWLQDPLLFIDRETWLNLCVFKRNRLCKLSLVY